MLSESLFRGLAEKPKNCLWFVVGILFVFVSKCFEDGVGDASFLTGSVVGFLLLVISVFDVLARFFFKKKLSWSWVAVAGTGVVVLIVLSQYTGAKNIAAVLIISFFVSVVMVLYKLYLEKSGQI